MGYSLTRNPRPSPAEPVLCHHDFRTGNYLLDEDKLTGILDWEFAGWGDPHEDIAWFCTHGMAICSARQGSRRHRRPRAVLQRLREREPARDDPVRVHFWEVCELFRWAVIALPQSDRQMLGGERSLDLALTGRRASECELAILMLLDRGGEPAASAASENFSSAGGGGKGGGKRAPRTMV